MTATLRRSFAKTRRSGDHITIWSVATSRTCRGGITTRLLDRGHRGQAGITTSQYHHLTLSERSLRLRFIGINIECGGLRPAGRAVLIRFIELGSGLFLDLADQAEDRLEGSSI